MPEKKRRIGARRRRLERNPFLAGPRVLLGQTEEEHRRWLADARSFLKACYRDAVDRLGRDEARSLFDGLAPRAKRGRPKGLTPMAIQLLDRYDKRGDLSIGGLSKQLALEPAPRQFKATEKTIEMRIRRALIAREEQEAEAADQAATAAAKRRWMLDALKDLATMLSEEPTKEKHGRAE